MSNLTTPPDQSPWLIRHAESEGNVGAVTHCPFSIRLTERGHQQAADLAATFNRAPDLIVVSPYLRTQQTAAPLIQRYPHVPVEQWPVHEFTYLNTTAHAGTTQDQRAVFAQAYWQRCDPNWRDGDGAESFADMIGRVDDLETQLCARVQLGLWVVVFTHGYFLKGLFHRRQSPAAAVDAACMASYRDNRRKDLPANAQVFALDQALALKE